MYIKQAEINKLVCMEHGCGEKVTDNELDKLFKEEEPETLEKLQ